MPERVIQLNYIELVPVPRVIAISMAMTRMFAREDSWTALSIILNKVCAVRVPRVGSESRLLFKCIK